MRVALDTNVLAYAEGVGDELRCSAAMRWVERLSSHEVVLPAQTLGELTRVLTGKAKRSAAQTRAAVLSWADSFEVADSTWFAFQSALDLTVDHQLPMWDALILAVVAENHCRLLLSEDFQNGFTWRGVTVVNPFVEPRSPLLAGLLR
ncbi:predicted nucleic-acid-binding protein, contains PIN domain [Serpentinimonas raichei]|uniref:Predicted nucleic-acid-binding protein, contains PIN domain n=1 Tax=Serpentinimonas raichei TaxID=1458425 RepID=A0A060NQL3_9BURK|nr:PIN domain-containing protein [Serpentinimonas raichei]BAO81808.1 predicted nucleic-acid-binding protein, contains PIN domain [Serpentinimonas raichei]